MSAAATLTGNQIRDVVVVGGGISGLTAAWHLRRGGADVALIEAQQRVGGSIQTEQRDGFLLEQGPFNVIVRDPAFEELLTALGDRINVVTASEAARKRYIYRHGRIHAVPTGPVRLFHTPLLSFGGACRAMRGLCVSRRGGGADTTIAEFAERRFGAEVADTLVSAAVAGILAGDTRRLSAYACFPVLKDFDMHSFSPLGRTLRRVPRMIRKRRDPKLRRKWRGLVSLDRGLGGLCAALADELGANVYTGCRLRAIHMRDGNLRNGSFALAVDTAVGPRELQCRRLVLATPAREAAHQLEELAPAASRLLAGVESASLTVLNLAFRRADIAHPLDGFGFLVPHNEPRFPLLGVLWADSAFPHHAPPGYRLLRVFVGGPRTLDLAQCADDELMHTACAALTDLLDLRGAPALVQVCRYAEALPQYHVGHEQRMAEVQRHIARIPGLALAGNYLAGVSINDCIKLSKQVAGGLLGQIPGCAASCATLAES
jgi:oxygen-dependent protoporphyrinogen oxidase